MKYLVCFVLLTFLQIDYTYSQDITPGLYHGSEPHSQTGGLYLLRADSTLVFFGMNNQLHYTTYNGKWSSQYGKLSIWKEIPTRPWTFATGELEYKSSSHASYDSAYFDITIADMQGNPISTTLQLTDKSTAWVKDGHYKGQIPIMGTTLLPDLTIFGGDRMGSFYTTKIPIATDRNDHVIKLKVLNLAERFPFIPLLVITMNSLRTFQLQKTGEGIYEGLTAKFSRITNKKTISEYFGSAHQFNPFFKPYFDALESEFQAHSSEGNQAP